MLVSCCSLCIRRVWKYTGYSQSAAILCVYVVCGNILDTVNQLLFYVCTSCVVIYWIQSISCCSVCSSCVVIYWIQSAAGLCVYVVCGNILDTVNQLLFSVCTSCVVIYWIQSAAVLCVYVVCGNILDIDNQLLFSVCTSCAVIYWIQSIDALTP